MSENPAKFFDLILTALSSDFNRLFLVNEVAAIVFNLPKGKVENGELTMEIPPTNTQKTNLINALLFLQKYSLVTLSNNNKEVCISSEGFVKIKTEGFSKEIKNKTINLWLQRGTWTCSILAIIISVYSAFFKN